MTFKLQILHASDLEGGIDAISNAPNFSAITDALEQDAAANDIESIFISAGDNYIQGPFFNAGGAPELGGTFEGFYNAFFGLIDESALSEIDDTNGDGFFDNTEIEAAIVAGNTTFDAVYTTDVNNDGFADYFEEIDSFEGRLDIAITNAIGVDASAVGNHEFDPGTDAFENIINFDSEEGNSLSASRFDLNGIAPGHVNFLQEVDTPGAQFPYLSANLDFSANSDLGSLFTDEIRLNTTFQSDLSSAREPLPGSEGDFPAVFETAGDVPDGNDDRIAQATQIQAGDQLIGVVGATTQLLESISSPGNVEDTTRGLEDPAVNDLPALAAVLQPVINDLIAAGSNIIVLTSHLQQFALEQELATLLEGVDVIIAGGSDTISANADDRLRAGDTADQPYPFLTTGADGNPTAIVSTNGEYTYVGRLVLEFDDAGVLTVDPLSGTFATDEQGVLDVTGAATLEDAIAASDIATDVANLTGAVTGIVTTQDADVAGVTSVYLNGEREDVRTQETNLGNLTADANIVAVNEAGFEATVSIKNGGGIRAAIGEIDGLTGEELVPQANPLSGRDEGEISELAIDNALRFNNELVTVNLTPEQLLIILEHGVSATGPGNTPGQFPQVGGLQFSFDPEGAAQVVNSATGEVTTEGSRIQTVSITDLEGNPNQIIVENGEVVDGAPASISVVTLNFLAGGGDGYPFAAFSDVIETGIGEQDALSDFLTANFPEDGGTPFSEADTGAEQDLRIQNLSVRSDVVGDVLPLEIDGTPGRDILNGDTGADIINGFAGADVIIGDDGNDQLNGGRGADTILGGDGDDVIDGGHGADTAIGGEGDDTINGGRGRDNLIGEDGDDTINGGGGRDTILGGDGNDMIDGGAGRDNLNGGDGDDTIKAGLNDISVDGGDDHDTIDLGNLNQGVTVNIAEQTATGTDTGAELEFENIENATGTTFADTLIGDGEDNVLTGLDGDDIFISSGGSDTYDGGEGNDTVDFSGEEGGVIVDLLSEQSVTNGANVAFVAEGTDTAEIVTFDTDSQQLFVAGGEFIDVFDNNGNLIVAIPVPTEVTSVSVSNGQLAASVPADPETDPGSVLLFNIADIEEGIVPDPVQTFTVGSLPDNLTFTPDGTKIIVANEGEADDGIDPEGTISIIDLATSTVLPLTFNAFDAQEDALIAEGLLIFGQEDGADVTVSQDLEPEFVAVAPDGSQAFVTLQENNAIAVVDLSGETPVISDIVPLGTKDLSLTENGIDGANDDIINIASIDNAIALFQPDAITSFEIGGRTFFATANEGDARDFDESNLENFTLDPTIFPNAAELQNDDTGIGNLEVSQSVGDTDGDGDLDQLAIFGGRSFSILDDEGNTVFESGNMISTILAERFPLFFNDNRSDDAGPEPEAVAIGEVNGETILFVGLERSASVLAFVVNEGVGGELEVDFRGFVALPVPGGFPLADDLDDLVAPEGLQFVAAAHSPTGQDLLFVSDEEAGNTYALNLALDTTASATLLGIENVVGTEFDDQIGGDNNVNVINGLDGDDLLQGRGGNDTINGGDGDDTILGGGGSDVTDGGGGIDTASFEDIGFGVTASLVDGEATYSPAADVLVTDTLINFENLTGSDFDDDLEGDAGANVIEGLDGDDVINGGRGADNLLGGDGEDTLNGNRGNDIIIGGDGNDVASGGRGSDDIDGGDGVDILFGNAGADTLSGGDDNGLLFGGNGRDTLIGGDDNDLLFGGNGRDTLIGGDGNDVLNGGRGIDTAIFEGSEDDFDIFEVGNVAIVTNLDDGSVDTLISVENIVFDDPDLGLV